MDDDEYGLPPHMLKALAKGEGRLAMRPAEIDAVGSLLDDLERAADRAGAPIATVSLLAIRELAAGLVAFGGARSLRDLMQAIETEVKQRAAELEAATDHDDLPPGDDFRRLPRPAVRH